METYSIVTLNDHFLVGSAASGHDFVQNMYGMYIRYEQDMTTDNSNLFISNFAHQNIYKPLISTSLGHHPAGDVVDGYVIIEGQDAGDISTDQLLRITRDYKDVLVSNWKTWEPDSTWEEFTAGPLGFELITAFEEDAAKFTYDVEMSYEELVSSPQRTLTSLVDHLLPRQDNDQLETFGNPKRQIDLNCIDQVVNDSQVRELREDQGPHGLLDSVGVHKQFLTQDQIDVVEEFISSL
tara:strand:- start:3684 stop:4397 length:714 start_codon:yes stop_codon:yes gene_type:complete